MSMRLFISLIAVVVFSVGCASAPPPPLNYSVPGVGISSAKKNAELRSIVVVIANANEATGKMYPQMSKTPGLWKTAMEEALNNMVIFKDDASMKVNLNVKITEFDPQLFGADMTSKVSARYEIMNRSNGDIIFSQNFSTSGTVAMSENILGAARIIESTNKAVRENIKQFLLALEETDFSRPMFPAAKGGK